MTTESPTPIQRALEVTRETALANFRAATRSAAFTLQLGVREIRLLHERPWGQAWGMQGAELAALQKLLEKGLLEHTYGESPVLSEAGHLVRQLLYLSRHVPADSRSEAAPTDILGWLAHAASWCNAEPWAWKRTERRTIDGEECLVISVTEAGGGRSEWAVPASAIKRIG